MNKVSTNKRRKLIIVDGCIIERGKHSKWSSNQDLVIGLHVLSSLIGGLCSLASSVEIGRAPETILATTNIAAKSFLSSYCSLAIELRLTLSGVLLNLSNNTQCKLHRQSGVIKRAWFEAMFI